MGVAVRMACLEVLTNRLPNDPEPQVLSEGGR